MSAAQRLQSRQLVRRHPGKKTTHRHDGRVLGERLMQPPRAYRAMRPSSERRFPSVGTVRYFLLRVHRADSSANGDSMNRKLLWAIGKILNLASEFSYTTVCVTGGFQGLEKLNAKLSKPWKKHHSLFPMLGKQTAVARVAAGIFSPRRV